MAKEVSNNIQLQAEELAKFLKNNATNFEICLSARQCHSRSFVFDASTQTSEPTTCTEQCIQRLNKLEAENRDIKRQFNQVMGILNNISTTYTPTIACNTPEPTPPETPETPANKSITIATQVMNCVQTQFSEIITPAPSVKYRIVSKGHQTEENENSEPIEVQLAEEDGALDLNNSVDSNPLQICLDADEPQQEPNQSQSIKASLVEEDRKLPLQELSSTNNKRRKISLNQNLINEHQYNRINYDNQHQSVVSNHFNVIQNPHTNDNNFIIYNNLNTSQPHLAERRVIQSTLDDDCEKIRIGINGTLVDHKSYVLSSQKFELRPGTGSSNRLEKDCHSKLEILNQPLQQDEAPPLANDNEVVRIGPNGTPVDRKAFEQVNWSSASLATRKLLITIFGRETLATHSMTGKPSPAFKGLNKPLKKRLNPIITEDIVYEVSQRCGVPEKDVRSAITTKCADENKMMKQKRFKEDSKLNFSNKENESFDG